MSFDLVGKAVKNLRLPTVDYNNPPIKIIPAQEGDINSRFFSVTLFDDRGDIPLTPYTKATLNATLPDGEKQITEGEIDKSNNYSICKVSGSMLSETGKVACDILLSGTDANGNIVSLTSQTFYLFVSKSQSSDEAIEGSDDYGLLVQLLNEVSDLEKKIETDEEERVVAEQSRVTSEDGRVNSEIQRESAESARIANETARQTAEEERVVAEKAREEELNNKLDKSDIVQATGQSTEAVMSQKAVTDNLAKKVEMVSSKSTVVQLYGVRYNSTETMMIEAQTSMAKKDSIPKRGANGTFAVGTPTNPTDAVNKEYVDNKFFRQKISIFLLFRVKLCLRYPEDPHTSLIDEKEKQIMSSKNSNKINVPEARAAMDKFKMEAAAEVDVPSSY